MNIITQNINALLALTGVMIGALFSFITMWVTKNREIQLKLREKILDRRIEAHEKCIELIASLRSSSVSYESIENPSSGKTEFLPLRTAEGKLATTPHIFESKKKYQEFREEKLAAMVKGLIWLSINVKREIFFLQDYFIDLDMILNFSAGDDCYAVAGIIIKPDLIEFAEKLEMFVNEFFTRDLTSMKLTEVEKFPRYSFEETVKRLKNTTLYKNRDKLKKLIQEISN